MSHVKDFCSTFYSDKSKYDPVELHDFHKYVFKTEQKRCRLLGGCIKPGSEYIVALPVDYTLDYLITLNCMSGNEIEVINGPVTKNNVKLYRYEYSGYRDDKGYYIYLYESNNKRKRKQRIGRGRNYWDDMNVVRMELDTVALSYELDSLHRNYSFNPPANNTFYINGTNACEERARISNTFSWGIEDDRVFRSNRQNDE